MQTRDEKLKEIEFQTKMLNNLKKWIRVLILLSTIGAAGAYYAFHSLTGKVSTVVSIVAIMFAAISFILCIIVGLAFKNGKANVEKIITSLK